MSIKLIVLIEDDVNLRQSFALILQRAGYTVTATDCVYEAMDLLRSGTYHLVISDSNIPETRRVLLPNVQAIYPEISIMILTDRSLSDAEKEDKSLITHYLMKPVAPERLLASVGALLSQSITSDHHEVNGTSDKYI